MKILLIQTITFVILLPAALFAQQQINVSQPAQNNSPCSDFPTPVIKPDVDENKLPIVKPDANIDFKLIIVNPCVSITEQQQQQQQQQQSISSLIVAPKSKDK